LVPFQHQTHSQGIAWRIWASVGGGSGSRGSAINGSYDIWLSVLAVPLKILGMVTPVCDKCRRRNVFTFKVEAEEAWRAVVLNRWRIVCASCFDGEAERAGIRYRYVNVRAMPWSEMPDPARRYGKKRR
jgi:hypothetical protein